MPPKNASDPRTVRGREGIGGAIPITSANHGQFVAVRSGVTGAVLQVRMQFVPDASFDGSFALMQRVYGKPAADDGVPYVPVQYQASYLNSATPASPVAYASDAITSTSILKFDASGLSITALVNCNAGFGYIYWWDLAGSPSSL